MLAQINPAKSNELVQLDGGNISDSEGSILTFSWNQIEGLKVVLNDETSVNKGYLTLNNSERICSKYGLTIESNPRRRPNCNEWDKRNGCQCNRGNGSCNE
jgi:hypothetical protein